mmetsp:Transcript_22262/g.63543  ORF Transcript_22262/g.63543 Transcript_22262/m.63543 type:complete len:114 (-) Transcript_22262:256-597(-)
MYLAAGRSVVIHCWLSLSLYEAISSLPPPTFIHPSRQTDRQLGSQTGERAARRRKVKKTRDTSIPHTRNTQSIHPFPPLSLYRTVSNAKHPSSLAPLSHGNQAGLDSKYRPFG